MNNNPLQEAFDNTGVRIALIGVLSILSLFLLVNTISSAENLGRPAHPATDTITVSGTGQATLPPDIARISFTVENTAASVSAAQAATTKQANAAIRFVKGQGILDADIKTLSYAVTPQYSYPNPCPPGVFCPRGNSSPTVTGYQVSETLQVKVHDLSQTGALLDGLGKLEVQNISGPAFGLNDATSGYDAARADAIEKAKGQAALLASELGVSLGKIVNFSESSGSPYPMMMRAAGAAQAATPEIPAGQNTYTASVSITYEIH